MVDKVKVRTLRQHDGSEGQKWEGDEYERTVADARLLEASGVVKIIGKLPSAKAEATSETKVEPAPQNKAEPAPDNKADPLDHDLDGKKGGSLPKASRAKAE